MEPADENLKPDVVGTGTVNHGYDGRETPVDLSAAQLEHFPAHIMGSVKCGDYYIRSEVSGVLIVDNVPSAAGALRDGDLHETGTTEEFNDGVGSHSTSGVSSRS
jgi:hypothetical protein